jgi:site-specific recombinase XerD
VPKIQQPIIEDIDSLAALLAIPPNTKKGLRDKVIMSVLYDGGIRLNELVTMKVASLDLSTDEIRIKLHGKRNQERTDFLDTKTSALVRQYLQEYHPEMDPKAPFIYTVVKGERGAMSARNIQKLIKKYADRIREDHNLPDSVSPHTFRRTRGTMLYRDNVPIEVVAIKLGHANTKTTRDHYTSPSHEQLRQLAAKRSVFIPDVEPIWPDNEDEMSRILGL